MARSALVTGIAVGAALAGHPAGAPPGPALVQGNQPKAAAQLPGTFGREPVWVLEGVEKGHTVERALLTYGKLDGREIGPWRVELRRPLPRASRAADSLLSAKPLPGRTGEGQAAAEPDPSPRRGPNRPPAKNLVRLEREPSPAPAGPAGAGELRAPLILVLPVGGLGKGMGHFFADGFADRGFAVLEIDRPPKSAGGGLLHSLKGTARTLKEDEANLERILSWVRRLDRIDTDRIGVLGVSRGAIAAALVAQRQSELSAVLVLGGADLAGLFRDSRLRRVRRMRRRERERAAGSAAKAQENAARILGEVDPAVREGSLDPTRTLLVNARWDRVVPQAQALALRARAGGATQAWLPTGHHGALLWARKVRRLAIEHFERTLADCPVQVPPCAARPAACDTIPPDDPDLQAVEAVR